MLSRNAHSFVPLWSILGLLVVAGAIYFIQHKKKTNSSDESQPQPQPQPQTKTQTLDIEVDVKPIIMCFSGFMNSLLCIMEGRDTENADITFTSIRQVVEGHGNESLKNWYEKFDSDRENWNNAEYRRKAKELLDILKSCGVRRSFEIKQEWNSVSELHYRKLDKIEDGQIFEVVEPCWIYNNKVFEKGLVKNVNN